MNATTRIVLVLLSLFCAQSIAAVPPAKVDAKSVPKKVYELPKTGVNHPRGAERWINAEVVGTRLVLKFFDKEKKPVPPDVVRGLAQFKYSSKNPEKAPLTVEGEVMVSPAKLRPPHNFLLLLTLFSADEQSETHSLRYP